MFTGLGILLGILALLTPYWEVTEPESYVGGLLVWAAILEILHGFRRAENQARMAAWVSGAFTLLIGMLLINGILWANGLEEAIQPDLDVSLVGPYKPSTFAFGGHVKGVKPAALEGFDSPIPAVPSAKP